MLGRPTRQFSRLAVEPFYKYMDFLVELLASGPSNGVFRLQFAWAPLFGHPELKKVSLVCDHVDQSSRHEPNAQRVSVLLERESSVIPLRVHIVLNLAKRRRLANVFPRQTQNEKAKNGP